MIQGEACTSSTFEQQSLFPPRHTPSRCGLCPLDSASLGVLLLLLSFRARLGSVSDNHLTTYCANRPASDGGLVSRPAFAPAFGGGVNNGDLMRNLIISLQDQLRTGKLVIRRYSRSPENTRWIGQYNRNDYPHACLYDGALLELS